MRDAQLTQIVLALGAARRFASGLHRRDNERHERADDRHDDQQFDEGKRRTRSGALRVACRMPFAAWRAHALWHECTSEAQSWKTKLLAAAVPRSDSACHVLVGLLTPERP